MFFFKALYDSVIESLSDWVFQCKSHRVDVAHAFTPGRAARDAANTKQYLADRYVLQMFALKIFGSYSCNADVNHFLTAFPTPESLLAAHGYSQATLGYTIKALFITQLRAKLASASRARICCILRTHVPHR